MEDHFIENNDENIQSIQEVTKRLSLAINVAQTVMPKNLADFIPNALLNITISRMIGIEGRQNTAILLSKLSELLLHGVDPEAQGPVQLSAQEVSGDCAPNKNK